MLLIKTKNKNRFIPYIVSFIFICLSILLSFIDIKFFLIISIPVVLYFIPKSIFERYYAFLFILSIFFLLPQANRYEILPIISLDVAILIGGIILFFFVLQFKFNTSYNLIFLFFTTYLIFQAARSYLIGYHHFYINAETIKYLFYPLGFYFTLSVFPIFKSKYSLEKSVFKMFLIILFFCLIISIEMFYYYFELTRGDRVITRQANLLLLGLLISLAIMFLFKLKTLYKIILIGLTFFYFLGIIIFMQRSLWIGTAVSLLLFFWLIIKYSNRIKQKKILISLIIAILLLTLGTVFFFKNISLNNKSFLKRTEVLDKGTETFSVAVRIMSYFEILKKIRNNPLFGAGPGDVIITSYLNQRVIDIVDNSYIVILWKYGIIGFIIFIWLYLKFFKQSLFLIKHSRNKYVFLIVLVIFSNFIGQIINGLACVIMVLYHFNFIWGALIGITDVIYTHEIKLQNKNL